MLRTLAIPRASVDRLVPWGLILVGLFGLYIFAFDNGHLIAAFAGQSAMQNNWLHEFFHDGRHLNGFMCH